MSEVRAVFYLFFREHPLNFFCYRCAEGSGRGRGGGGGGGGVNRGGRGRGGGLGGLPSGYDIRAVPPSRAVHGAVPPLDAGLVHLAIPIDAGLGSAATENLDDDDADELPLPADIASQMEKLVLGTDSEDGDTCTAEFDAPIAQVDALAAECDTDAARFDADTAKQASA